MRITPKNWIDLMPIVADRGWKEDKDGKIRDKDGACPISAICNEVVVNDSTIFLWTEDALGAAQSCFGTASGVSDIMTSSDNFLGYTLYRKRIKQALGMA